MDDAKLVELVDEAVTISQQIKAIESGELASLNSMLNMYKIKIKDAMDEMGVGTAEATKGKVSLIQSKGKSVVDSDAIMAALGVETLDQYKKIGKPYEYLLLTEFKK